MMRYKIVAIRLLAGRQLEFDEHGSIRPFMMGSISPEIIPEGISRFYVSTIRLNTRMSMIPPPDAIRHVPYARQPRRFAIDTRHVRPANVHCTLRWRIYDDRQTCAEVFVTDRSDRIGDNAQPLRGRPAFPVFHTYMWFVDPNTSRIFGEYMVNGRGSFRHNLPALRNIIRNGNIPFRVDWLLTMTSRRIPIIPPENSPPPHYLEGSFDFTTRRIWIQGHGTVFDLHFGINTEDTTDPTWLRQGNEIAPVGRGFASFTSELAEYVANPIADPIANPIADPGATHRPIMTMPPMPPMPPMQPMQPMQQQQLSNSNSNRSNGFAW
jgi:hypothetical protein